MQDRTYTPPVVEPFGKSRADSSSSAAAHAADADVVPKEGEEEEEEEDEDEKYPSSPNQKKRSSGLSSNDIKSDNDKKLVEQDLTKDAPDITAQEEEFESYGFAHPAASRPQRVVWISKDTLGLTAEEVKGCEEAKVKVGFRNAKLDETGKVDIDGGPPDLI